MGGLTSFKIAYNHPKNHLKVYQKQNKKWQTVASYGQIGYIEGQTDRQKQKMTDKQTDLKIDIKTERKRDR